MAKTRTSDGGKPVIPLDNLNGPGRRSEYGIGRHEKKRLRIDLSEHGGQPYYSGFTVKVYVEGAAAAVAFRGAV